MDYEKKKLEVLWRRGEIACKTIDRLKSRLQSRCCKGSRRPQVEQQLFREVLAMIADIQDRLGWTENFDEMRKIDGVITSVNIGHSAYEPSHEVIAECCERLQEGWSESERKRRAPHLAGDGPVIPERVEFAMK